jgi:hypothetical protein
MPAQFECGIATGWHSIGTQRESISRAMAAHRFAARLWIVKILGVLLVQKVSSAALDHQDAAERRPNVAAYFRERTSKQSLREAALLGVVQEGQQLS